MSNAWLRLRLGRLLQVSAKDAIAHAAAIAAQVAKSAKIPRRLETAYPCNTKPSAPSPTTRNRPDNCVLVLPASRKFMISVIHGRCDALHDRDLASGQHRTEAHGFPSVPSARPQRKSSASSSPWFQNPNLLR